MIGVLLVFVLTFVLQLLTGSWWWIIVVPFLYSLLLARSGWGAVLAGAGGVGSLWFLSALIALVTTAGRIASRVALMMGLGKPVVVLLAATLLAVVVAGIAGAAGYHVGVLFGLRIRRKPPTNITL
jgi:hypothetical protein